MNCGPLCICALVGALGGFGNGLLVNGGLIAPRKIKRADKRLVLELGTLSSLLIGALSGMGAYWVLALDPLAVHKDLGVVFITGLGGDSFLSNLMHKREAVTQSEIADQFEKVVKNELSPADKEQ
jgi:hypothetical protein